ncbi:sulfotransferase domain-containing protein [Terrabacter terrae]
MSRRSMGTTLGALQSRLARGERLLPGYLVVGTKRGGSTSLAEWITLHPQVGKVRSGKGTHYFDVNFGRGFRWYTAQFPKVDEGFSLVGESSPYYMFHPLSPQRIRAALPDVKIVMCLRDPIARAWSHHAYEVARGHEDESFERALDLEESRLVGEEARIVADPQYQADHWRYHAYLRRGHYAEQVHTFHQLFGPDQVLVVQSEALFADPQGQMDRVFSFLGLAPHRCEQLLARNANKPYGEMTRETFTRLVDHFTPLNHQLYAMPGIDFAWPYDR